MSEMVVVVAPGASDGAGATGELAGVAVDGSLEDSTDGVLVLPDDDSQDARIKAAPAIARRIDCLNRMRQTVRSGSPTQ